jgi:cyanophycinase-like exopeptidase
VRRFTPGKITLFGSGETSANGRKVFDYLFRSMSEKIRVAILETPAGFELNSDWVARQVATFLTTRLKNYDPEIKIVPARKRGTHFSPDNPEIVKPLLTSNVIYMGAGSPTYAVKQLRDSLAWNMMVAQHRLGVNLVWASASPLAISTYTIPVYEIYKVGEELHWKKGLDFFKPFGLEIVFVPHWNNKDGGENLDTSHCFMGLSRFSKLLEMLPKQAIVVGIEEHTALVIDIDKKVCHTMGKGGVILRKDVEERRYENTSFSIGELGSFHLPDLSDGIAEEVINQAFQALDRIQSGIPPSVPSCVIELLEARECARGQSDWMEADRLRDEIYKLGWIIRDTEQGPELILDED